MSSILSCILIIIIALISINSVLSTATPTSTPSIRPSSPTGQPTAEPTTKPTSQPTAEPSTFKPSSKPSLIPTSQPSKTSSTPTITPSQQPTFTPSIKPSSPTFQPSVQPSYTPSSSPSIVPTNPTSVPSIRPSRVPTSVPSRQPVSPTFEPSVKPTFTPTYKPSFTPTYSPTTRPTATPITIQPTISSPPTLTPTYSPTIKPSNIPTSQPTAEPSYSQQPTGQPTSIPSKKPTSQPSVTPSKIPTYVPTRTPSQPTVTPSCTPTVDPTYTPSITPTFDPTSLPTTDPTETPTLQPSTPTVTPTEIPSSLPTISTIQPSTPTETPTSNQPSLNPSYKPSILPTYKPSIRPSAPSYSPSLLSAYPTTAYNLANLTGNIQFDPVYTGLCQNAEIRIQFQVSRVINKGDVIRIQTPGLTTGPCSQPVSGENIAQIKLWNSSQFVGTYAEGNVSYGFRDSYFEFSVNVPSGLQIDEKYFITLDRNNGFKRSCSSNYTDWSVFIGRCNKLKHCKNYVAYGKIPVMSPLATVTDSASLLSLSTSGFTETSGVSQCFAYSSSLFISPAEPHMVHTINMQFSFPFALQKDSQIIVYLPGFTNRKKFINITDLSNDFTTTSSTTSSSTTLLFSDTNRSRIQLTEGIEWTSQFDWLVYWEEGDSTASSLNDNTTTSSSTNDDEDDSNNFKYKYYNSRLIIVPTDDTETGLTLNSNNNITVFYLSINRFPNVISSLYGQSANFTGFMYEVLPSLSSSTSVNPKSNFYIPKTSFDTTNQIGSGCSQFKNCQNNHHGKCLYQKDICLCNDGYGSKNDKQFAVSNDFLLDCSAHACPVGPASVSVPLPPLISTSTTGSSGSSTNNNTTIASSLHRLIECSNNGLCNRKNGQCQCFTGYKGPACQRRTCGGGITNNGNVCSGRGMCMNIKNLAKYSTAMPLTYNRYRYEHNDDVTSTSSSGSSTLAWDENLNHACVCDSAWAVGLESGETQQAEYFGVTCEKRHCPSGDDPKTRFIDETNCTGINVYYRNLMSINSASNAAADALNDNGYNSTTSNNNSNNTTTAAVKYDVGKLGNKCHVDCSNSGACDYNTGICTCYPGYTGPNCGIRLGYSTTASSTGAINEDFS